MEFGPIPVAAARGAILAHSLDLTSGRLRKGRVLTCEDQALLRADGVATVIAARLSPGDLHEDAAATRIAAAVAGQGLRVTQAATGRVNLHATGPGIVRVDRSAVDALNAVDPMITLATVPEWHRADPDGMVGTVKIIAYGVDGTAVDRAAAAGAGALCLLPPVFRTVTLIETTTTDTDPNPKGRAAMQGRLDRLGIGLDGRVIVPHRADAISDALHAAEGEVLMILTASATSDIHDVAPSAVGLAGGRVDRFGMPVDPGNLLLIGAMGSKPVIGLPGCARSPALNGADWVLERVLCGVPVGAAEIAAMGVGGLLKEIPTRPQPRTLPRG
ncbi:molybdopterin biosynthesis protein [Loktanella sp. IMCC34160]|uniref:molybdopterin-binding protein n=1 Tax=Loktanella sp. IMCC34160 TaxID=2510646 RepID=UPI00101D79A5|nr:molybdopterin-binding protein [Loktanella sp. IMCC34160]RYG91963.1 molybdopterin biosynthesis protein [Loktanella sp. IMCC34160]